MSHFTVIVIGNDPEKQLAPFNENLEVPRYQKYSKQELIDNWKQQTEEYRKAIYAHYIKDPVLYEEKHKGSPGHIEYLKNEFPKRLEWNDEQIYAEEISNYDDIGPDGEVYSTYNPNSKWDWYSLGGRWSGMIELKKGATSGVIGKPGAFNNKTGYDQARKSDIANLSKITTHALLMDGKWYEQGEMGWWGVVHYEKPESEWEAEFQKLINGLPDDTLISIYDLHI